MRKISAIHVEGMSTTTGDATSGFGGVAFTGRRITPFVGGTRGSSVHRFQTALSARYAPPRRPTLLLRKNRKSFYVTMLILGSLFGLVGMVFGCISIADPGSAGLARHESVTSSSVSRAQVDRSPLLFACGCELFVLSLSTAVVAGAALMIPRAKEKDAADNARIEAENNRRRARYKELVAEYENTWYCGHCDKEYLRS